MTGHEVEVGISIFIVIAMIAGVFILVATAMRR